jgi:SpoVK/Ycf46/Vps4 family AAA+-type ATPase
LLDGESQIDFVLNLATTNYPEKLDRRIVARPRRFDRIIKVDMPGATVRQAYFEAKLTDASPAEIESLVEKSDGLSFAAMAEIIISVKCLDNNLEETLETLREMHKRTPSSREYDSREMGFGGRP